MRSFQRVVILKFKRRRRRRRRWRRWRGSANARRRKYWVYFEILFRCVGREPSARHSAQLRTSALRARSYHYSNYHSTIAFTFMRMLVHCFSSEEMARRYEIRHSSEARVRKLKMAKVLATQNMTHLL